jgi:hypothetical protein
MHYQGYAEFEDDEGNIYLTVDGYTNTTADMNSNGSMDGTMTASGMYAGTVDYGHIEIKGGGAGGGYYVVQPAGFPTSENVDRTLGE